VQDKEKVAPDSTAVRVALWRALHLLVDEPPHVLQDDIGLRLVGPREDWRERPDMDVNGTRTARASIVSRARFVEDLVAEQVERGVNQYVILGAGLDTFAQRRPQIAARLRIFEVDRPGPQQWKQQRLEQLGYEIPNWLRFVPVDFEAKESWWDRLVEAGFDVERPAVVASMGVTMYLTKDAVNETLNQIAQLAPGSTLAMTFLLPLDLLEPEARAMQETTMKAAQASGTPFISFFSPEEIMNLAQDAGFRDVVHTPVATLAKHYFGERMDDLPPSGAEQMLVAGT
jgi:methyltransferase (TIGR00027 family)